VYSRLNAHEVLVKVDGSPGTVVVLDPSHPDWQLTGPNGKHPVPKALGRYIAFPTPGGERAFTLSFEPTWPFPALLLAGAGALACLVLGARAPRPRSELDTVEPAR
jgi:hypothetical protein